LQPDEHFLARQKLSSPKNAQESTDPGGGS
jgi:hypothetical protein